MPSASVMTRESSDPRLGLVEVGDREAADVALDAAPHLGDRALGGLAEDLGEGEGGDGLDQGRRRRRPGRSGRAAPRWPLPMTSSSRNLVVPGSTRPASAVDEQQAEAEAPGVPCGRGRARAASRRMTERGRTSSSCSRRRAGAAAAPRRSASRRARGEAAAPNRPIRAMGSGLPRTRAPGGRARPDCIGATSGDPD